MSSPQSESHAGAVSGTHFYLIGIGGAGMSVLAQLLLALGATVSGSDREESDTTRDLSGRGVTVFIGQKAANVPPDAIVVYSSAIKDSNPELVQARRVGLPMMHRSEALALAASGLEFIAVAGSHGKTTTSSMIASALYRAGYDPSWAIGGSLKELGSGGRLGSGSFFVAEADESDESFLNYTPRVEVVTNVEPDHLDHYGSALAYATAFVQFAQRLEPGGLLVVCSDQPEGRQLAREAASEGIRVQTYGFKPGVDSLDHMQIMASGVYTLRSVDYRINLAVPGAHNMLNAAGALSAALDLSVAPDSFIAGLEKFDGAGRRFDLKGTIGGVRLYDDYAHHPTEVRATLVVARGEAEKTSGHVRVLFQPHMYSRTQHFARAFAQELLKADSVIVTSVFAAREVPEQGEEGDSITAKMHGRAQFIPDMNDAARVLADMAREGDVLITMGAGSINHVDPIILQRLQERGISGGSDTGSEGSSR
ncbi:MAG: UDP-N-acetylmuramate--L-alanine ligase [Actinomycetaceae bacterium]|nr:UDP-N-acetylmuramate--L-alanine ligase [Actinomycetaceae bacterium]MDY6083038.1 UDP-N-acetylmuramate--L-alanine ligase [Actinomycetaceae bacterium]